MFECQLYLIQRYWTEQLVFSILFIWIKHISHWMLFNWTIKDGKYQQKAKQKDSLQMQLLIINCTFDWKTDIVQAVLLLFSCWQAIWYGTMTVNVYEFKSRLNLKLIKHLQMGQKKTEPISRLHAYAAIYEKIGLKWSHVFNFSLMRTSMMETSL